MKKYFVISDIHSFYTPMIQALNEVGFDINNSSHILVCLGDLLDRGDEARKVVDYFYTFPKDRLILIRGNHEDLFDELISNFTPTNIENDNKHNLLSISLNYFIGDGFSHNRLYQVSNGTLDTICQLGAKGRARTIDDTFNKLLKGNITINYNSKYFKEFNELKNRMLDYYEIGDYIFTHGWIPVKSKKVYDYNGNKTISYEYDKDWRSTPEWQKEESRWLNGMEMASLGLIEPNKTIVCGHFHTGWGHYRLHHEGNTELDNLDIYRDNGIIAIDACTAYSHKVNCLVIEEENEE